MRRLLALPEPENARDLIIERLTIERDAAIADLQAAHAELHQALCVLKLQVHHMESMERGRALIRGLSKVKP